MRTPKKDFTLVSGECSTFVMLFTLDYSTAIRSWVTDWLLSAHVVLTILIARSLREASDVIDSKRAILQVRIREEDKQHAERLYEAMGTSLAEAVRLFVAQSILMRKLPFQPVAVRSKDGTAAYGSLKAYGDPNRRSEERNAWIEYLATENDDSILGPEEVDIHE